MSFALKRCLVVCDGAAGIIQCRIEAPVAATLEECLALARAQLPEAGVDWQGACGVWGRVCDRSAIPADGDRIELYRPLSGDPRTRRRARVAQARALARRSG